MPVDMDYAISVLHDDNKLNLGDRPYIFQGGTMTQNNEAGEPENVPWCFEYGEANWVSGVSFNDKRDDAIGDAESSYVGRINCITGENLL